MAERICVMCNQNKAGGDGLCVKCRFQINTKYSELCQDTELLLPEGRYYGKTRNGIPNGKGELTYQTYDGRASYHGDFKDGMRHGHGKLTYRNGAYYEGEWVCDKQEGYGEESLPGGTSIEGYYASGELVRGRVYFGDGREYEGEWSDDCPNGNGKMYFRNGHAEEGFWIDGVCVFKETPTEEELRAYLEQLSPEPEEKREVVDLSLEADNDSTEQEKEESGRQLTKLTDCEPGEVNSKDGSAGDLGLSEDITEESPMTIWQPYETTENSCEETVDMMAGEEAAVEEKNVLEEAAPAEEAVSEAEAVPEEEAAPAEEVAFEEEAAPAEEAAFEEEAAPAEEAVPEEEVVSGEQDYPNGEHYVGQFLDGKRHGIGTMTYPNGDVYEGGYQFGKRHGQGRMTYANGNVYDGQWENSKKSGKGILVMANGDRYEGEFVAGAFNGYGIYRFANGNCYEGGWNLNTRDGRGHLVYADGRVEEQLWENGVKQLYEPEINGQSEENNENTDNQGGTMPKTEGESIEDAASVKEYRCLRFRSGNQYEGEVNELNQPDGIGTYVFTNGSVYEGEFKNGCRDGIGVFTWNTGDVYEGEWSRDLRHGQGRMVYANGKICEGLFEDNKFVG